MLAVMITTSCVSAQENKGSDNVVKVPTRFDQACNTDIEKYCSNVQAGDGRIASCLYAHTDLLEGECYAATSQIGTILERVFDGIEVFYAACQVDLGKWCPEVKAGTGGQIACLQENLDNISAGCSAAMPGTTASGR
jgi:Golgi apparatus protein 1